MKKTFTLVFMLCTVLSIAMAQPAMKGNGDGLTQVSNLCTSIVEDREILDVEIVSYDGMHFTHPETELMCPIGCLFTTTENYEWYLWETGCEVESFSYSDPEFLCELNYSCYVKVTVGDTQGNTGSDSIWFNIKENHMLEGFMMEVGDDLYPTFKGVAAPDHYRLRLQRNYNGSGANVAQFMLEPGEWEFRDEGGHYQEDGLWAYQIFLRDTCRFDLVCLVPGMLLETESQGSDWSLLTMTDVSQNGIHYQDSTFVYFVYTIDEMGQRHHYMQGGGPVILDQYTTSWQIPGPHVDPYYQCGVARRHDDGTYELLSLSNKVPNPLHDINGVDELDSMSMSVYPNPAPGRFTVEGQGTMTISNVMGQNILTCEIDGKETIELPRGMYFVKLGGETRKIVVE